MTGPARWPRTITSYALATFVTGLIEPSPYVFLAAVPVIVSLCRRRPIVALAIVGIIAAPMSRPSS